ncbi:MAG: phosphoglucosamine mutase [Tenericutes bacterium]|nr:phosphoglucosamine mutase [Mycoplasmatota bacterium]
MKYFGTDGIRGKAYTDITRELSYRVGRSMELLERKLVIIGRDTRESGNMIVEELKKGILDAGLTVLDLEIVPTPLLAYYSILKNCHGIMVTASHNPYEDNGIKIFNKGRKTTIYEETEIEAVIDALTDLPKKALGEVAYYENPLKEYFALYSSFITKSKYKVALDLANGATVKSAKYIFNQITNHIKYIGDAPDGLNINLGVGSTHLEKLTELVKKEKFDVGFAFDGDGDRVLAIDKTGRVIDGDLMIYIIAVYLFEQNLLKNNTVVLTKMSNIGIIQALEEKGIKVVQTDVGDKYVVEALHNLDGVIGGENSGHIINRNLFISGDGVLNAAYLLKIMKEKSSTLGKLVQDVTLYPDSLVNLKNIDKTIINDKRIINLVNKYKKELGNKGKILVRASGTEALIRISVSAQTEEIMNHISNAIVGEILTVSKERKS